MKLSFDTKYGPVKVTVTDTMAKHFAERGLKTAIFDHLVTINLGARKTGMSREEVKEKLPDDIAQKLADYIVDQLL